VAEIDDVAAELVLLFRSLKAMHRTLVSQSGLRLEMPATAMLATLDESGRQRASTLAEVLHVDLSSVSRQVAALEREGWLRRERDPADSRAALLELTDAGREVLDQVRRARLDHLARRLPGWTGAELQDFAAQLRRFRTDLSTPEQSLPPRPDGPSPDSPADSAPAHSSASPADPDRIPAHAGKES